MISDKERYFRWFSLALLFTAVLLLFIAPVLRAGFKFEISYNEGWNVFHNLKVASGQILYDGRNEWTPVDYPPFSFYILGSIGRIIKNPLLVGRGMALLSLLVIIVTIGLIINNLGGKVYESVFASILCLGLFLVCASKYIGTNDPQFFGHAFAISALSIYLNNKINKSKIFMVALLCSITLYIKHNLVVIPIVITLDLLLKSRRDFFRWVFYMSIIAGGLFSLTYLIFGSEFLRQISLSFNNTYSLHRALKSGLYLSIKIFIPLVVILPLIIKFFKYERFRFISLYFVLSFITGFYTLGSSGADVNMFFDVIISISIAAAMLLIYLRTSFHHFIYQKLIYSIVPIILGFGIFVETSLKIGENEIFPYAHYKYKQKTFLDDANFIASHSGPVLCEYILFCFFAEKTFEFDSFNACEMILTKKADEKKILRLLESGYFSVVQLNRELSDKYLKEMNYVSVQRSNAERFTENFMRAIGKYYMLIRKSNWGAFYIPKDYEKRIDKFSSF